MDEVRASQQLEFVSVSMASRRPPRDAYYAAPDHYPTSATRPLRPMPMPQNDQSGVILVTAGYDHTIKFWEALSGICSRTIQHPDSVSFLLFYG